jgi:hypothetical protein
MSLDYVLGSPILERNGGALVRLANDVNKCVVFLGPEQGKDIDLAGTAFFLMDGGGPDTMSYLVTARHVARALVGPIGIRFNTKAGEFRVCPIERPDWEYFPDPNVDLAAMAFIPPAWADVVPFHVRYFATDFKIGTKNFGAGDFVYVVALYRLLRATRRNIPLVHTGHIAALMADEPIPVVDSVTGEETQARGYLVESRAISGASGSPVFVRRSIQHMMPDPAEPDGGLRASTPGSVWLLGLWQASWPQKPEQDLLEGVGLPKDVRVSVGVGIVVPAPFIQVLLEMPKIKKQREQIRKERAAGVAATTDSALPTKAENPQHREDFNRLLDAAAKGKQSTDRT